MLMEIDTQLRREVMSFGINYLCSFVYEMWNRYFIYWFIKQIPADSIFLCISFNSCIVSFNITNFFLLSWYWYWFLWFHSGKIRLGLLVVKFRLCLLLDLVYYWRHPFARDHWLLNIKWGQKGSSPRPSPWDRWDCPRLLI